MNYGLLAEYYNQHMMDGQDGGWAFAMMLFFIILVAVLFLFIVKSKNNSHYQANTTNPLDIVKSRYAKGEITKVQFDELKKDLKD